MDNQTVRLVPLPGTSPAGESYLKVHLDAPDAAAFEPHWDRPVPDQCLAGLTVDEALAKLTEALLDSVYGHH